MKIAASLLLLLASSVSAFVAPQFSASPALTGLRMAEATAEAEATALRGAAEISALTSSVETIFSSEDIDKILPHRYPFALVDKVIEYEAGKRAVGIKSVTKVRRSLRTNTRRRRASLCPSQ